MIPQGNISPAAQLSCSCLTFFSPIVNLIYSLHLNFSLKFHVCLFVFIFVDIHAFFVINLYVSCPYKSAQTYFKGLLNTELLCKMSECYIYLQISKSNPISRDIYRQQWPRHSSLFCCCGRTTPYSGGRNC